MSKAHSRSAGWAAWNRSAVSRKRAHSTGLNTGMPETNPSSRKWSTCSAVSATRALSVLLRRPRWPETLQQPAVAPDRPLVADQRQRLPDLRLVAGDDGLSGRRLELRDGRVALEPGTRDEHRLGAGHRDRPAGRDD